MIEIGKEINEYTCCLCLSDEESTFHSNSVLRSLPLRDMVDYCIGVQLKNISDAHQPISTSICNECVLNVSNFYTFKKKIIQAQALLGALNGIDDTAEDENLNEPKIENNGELSTDIAEGDEIEHILVEEHLRSPAENEIDDSIEEEIQSSGSNQHPPKDEIRTKRTRLIETNPKAQNKRPKVISDAERVTIQMNECLICPAVLDDILQLDNHIVSHKQINCKVCHRSFARYSNLKRHFMAVHSKPKPFQCDLCGLGFSFSVNLQAHAALHYSGKIRMKQ